MGWPDNTDDVLNDEFIFLFPPNSDRDNNGWFTDLGETPLVRHLGLRPEQTNGHWCSRCEGIWFGYTLEVECPICGNQRG